MECGSTIYPITAKIDGADAQADLAHLERALHEWGYSVTPTLQALQTGEKSFAEIGWAEPPSTEESRGRPSRCIIGHSFVERRDDGFRLVVSPYAVRLDEFARNYEPTAQPTSMEG